MSDTFEHATFQQSLLKIFEKDANGHFKFATNATIEVLVSPIYVPHNSIVLSVIRLREKLKLLVLLVT